MTTDPRQCVVDLQITGALARLRINHPPLNILTVKLRTVLLERILELEAQPNVKVLIIEGGEQAFAVGSDIREFPDDLIGGLAKIRFEQYLLDRLAQLHQISIVGLRGHVLGGGAEIMLSCDLRVAGEQARIGFPEIRIGALPAAGGIRRLVQDIGPVLTRELVLTGKTISAAEALQIRLINKVVPEADLTAQLEAFADELLRLPSDALRLAKRCIEAAAATAGADTAEAEAFASLYRGGNLREGVAAFKQKRAAHFDEHD
jgi:enoyl-CoA hydratase/carnithine racemase